MFFKVAVVSLLGYLALVHTPSPLPAAAVPGSAGPPPAPMVVVVPATASTTRVVDVRRSDLERAMLQHAVRAVPVLRSGQASGIKLYAIRPLSPFAALGLENGDTLLAVNDVPISLAGAPIELYRQWTQADHLDLDIERGGQPVRILVLVH
jgi:general secretion pathway protein C